MVDTTAELDQLLSKESWTQEDLPQLRGILYRMREPAARLRQALARLSSAHPRPAGTEAVKIGLAKYMLCQFAEAAEILGDGTDNKDRRFYQALCYKHLRQWDQALENLQYAEDRGWDPHQVSLERAEVYCLWGDLDKSAHCLERFAKSSQDDAGWHYMAGMLAEMRGEYDAAVASYETARRLSPGHAGATFRLAYFNDLHGDEETAVELYRQCINPLERPAGAASPAPASPAIYTHSLLNLAVLYEDAGRNDDAARCLRRILVANPRHARAALFLKDVQASRTMRFDEDETKRIARRTDLLNIPVTDFELSVRARNCLKKMNIRILGDLLKVNEADLLSYKNFGETSLSEIKAMLSSKSLRLGLLREEGEELRLSEPEPVAAAASVGNEGVLATPISQIEFSVRVRRALERLNVKALGDLAQKTEAELLGCRNFGQTSLNEVVQRLAEYGLRLREP